MDPEYYEEFQYRSKGLVKDVFLKRKVQKELQKKLDVVLEKYKRFERPYFVNYLHMSGREGARETPFSGGYESLQLFHAVLLELGFSELAEFPELTGKLIRSTAFRFTYEDFVARTACHIRDSLDESLRCWIKEAGGSFRTTLPMLVYYLWSNRLLEQQITYSKQAPPLLEGMEWERIYQLSEKIYFQVLVKRFRTTLEKFDPTRFVTIYTVDALSGYEFEDFLGTLLTAIGFSVQVTKRSGDQGADLFAEKFGKKIVIQAKNYRDSVGNSAVQQVLAAKAFYSCDEAMVITNSRFTPSAKELASSTGVQLVDRDILQTYLDEYNQQMMEVAAREEQEGDRGGSSLVGKQERPPTPGRT